MLMNAHEHGNLEISYNEKSNLVRSFKLHEEIERRESLPEFNVRKVRVKLVRKSSSVELIVSDDGKGFNPEQYMEMNTTDRALDVHGRGIAMSKIISFDEIVYNEKGNEVKCIINK